MAKGEKPAEKPRALVDADGKVYGPCGDCAFYVEGEGLGSIRNKGRCHGNSPVSGLWPGVPAAALGCGIFRARS